jgi:hypothetical protein
MTDVTVEKKNKQAINARRLYLRMRVDEIKSEMAKNLDEFNAIKAALPKADGADKKTMMTRATYLRNRNPALAEERTALIAEDKTLRPPATAQAKPATAAQSDDPEPPDGTFGNDEHNGDENQPLG